MGEPIARVEPGDRLGPYVVLESLGTGGMGVVLSAYDSRLDRKVAIKLLRPDLGQFGSTKAESVHQRLRREAQAMARLAHPNVVDVYDVGEHHGRLFVAMAFVDGGTLRDWLRARVRTWREIVEVFVSAGRGLAAAHAVGLVHRDFKPENVLIENNGAVRVTDFGLALFDQSKPPVGGSSQGPEVEQASGESSLTEAGTVVGTPAYMAPEQHRGATTDARSDQYGFCVSLFEALYHQRPFAPSRGVELLKAKLKQNIAATPADADVPAWLRSVLLQGLSRTPAQRWPSMDALLDQLERGPSRTRRRWLASVALVAAIGAFTVVLEGPDEAVCTHSRRTMDGIWNDTRRSTVRERFEQTGVSYARETLARIEPALDRYAERWIVLHRVVCEASHVRHVQSGTLLDVRMACLRKGLSEAGALIAVLEQADAQVVERAGLAVHRLRPLTQCRDLAFESTGDADDDRRGRDALAPVHAVLAKANAFHRAGKYTDGVAAAEHALAQATELGEVSLEAEALIRLGRLQSDLARYEEAHDNLARAFWLASASDHNRPAAFAATMLVLVEGLNLARTGEGLRWARHAASMLERFDATDDERAKLANNVGIVLVMTAAFEGSREQFEHALTLWEQSPGEHSADIAMVVDNLGGLMSAIGQFERARAYHERAVAIYERVLGPNHPQLAATLGNLGGALVSSGHVADGRAALARALELRERAFGPRHPDVALLLHNIATMLHQQRHYREARVYYERALAIREAVFSSAHRDIAFVLNGLGSVLRRQGDLELATEHLQRGLEIMRLAAGAENPDTAMLLVNLGNTFHARGLHREARTYYREALVLLERSFGSSHPHLAHALRGVGLSTLALGDHARARAFLERAKAAVEHTENGSLIHGEVLQILARALDAGGEYSRAHATALQARDIYAAIDAPEEVAKVEAWLRDHGRRGSGR